MIKSVIYVLIFIGLFFFVSVLIGIHLEAIRELKEKLDNVSSGDDLGDLNRQIHWERVWVTGLFFIEFSFMVAIFYNAFEIWKEYKESY